MKEMVREKCHWCEYENVTTGGCILNESGDYAGDVNELGGEACPAYEKYAVKRYGNMHLKYMAEFHEGTWSVLLVRGGIEERKMMVDKTVTQKISDMMKAALEKDPGPDPDHILERAGYLNNLKKSFEEILLPEYVYNEEPFPMPDPPEYGRKE